MSYASSYRLHSSMERQWTYLQAWQLLHSYTTTFRAWPRL